MSIYIPKVFSNTKEEDFKYLFEVWGIGKVRHVDIIKSSNGSSQAYVHFEYWYNTLANEELQKSLNNETPVKKYYTIPKSLKKEETSTKEFDDYVEEEDLEEEDLEEEEEEEEEEYYEEDGEHLTDKSFFWVFLKNKSKKQIPGEKKITLDLSGLTKASPTTITKKVVPSIFYAHVDYYSQIMKVNKEYKDKIMKLVYDSIYGAYFPSEMYYENLSEYYNDILASTEEPDQASFFATEYKSQLDFTYNNVLQMFHDTIKIVLPDVYNIPKMIDEVSVCSENLVNNNIILEIEKENYYLYNKLQQLLSSIASSQTELVGEKIFL